VPRTSCASLPSPLLLLGLSLLLLSLPLLLSLLLLSLLLLSLPLLLLAPSLLLGVAGAPAAAAPLVRLATALVPVAAAALTGLTAGEGERRAAALPPPAFAPAWSAWRLDCPRMGCSSKLLLGCDTSRAALSGGVPLLEVEWCEKRRRGAC
jgi:hypothetical protein